MTFAVSRNPMNRWHKSWDALALLAECPTGATGPALEARGFPEVTLGLLVADGLAWSVLRQFANPPGLTVMHYHVTDAGKKALAERNAPCPSTA